MRSLHRRARNVGFPAPRAPRQSPGCRRKRKARKRKKAPEAHERTRRRVGALKGEFGGDDADRVADPDHPAAYACGHDDLVRQTSFRQGAMWIEQRVALTDQIWGRCDVAHWEESTGILTIPDLKNGQRAVDVGEKSQLRIYAAASMFTHNLPVKWIRYVVVQPNDWRPFVPRVKQWHEPVESLYAWASRVACDPKGPKSFNAGDHCRDCPLFGKCSASLDMLSDLRRRDRRPDEPEPGPAGAGRVVPGARKADH
jgi:hypothetical protein